MSKIKEKSIVLAVETSSRIGSVAIAIDGKVLGETVFSAPLQHSAEIFPAVEELLCRFNFKPGQIEEVYISGGPGSFTGLRIATTLAKTMHLAHAAKVVAVDTLDVVAANVINLISEKAVSKSGHKMPLKDDEKVAAVLDAKRGQFFIAVYQHKTDSQKNTTGQATWKKILPDCLMTPSQFLDKFACKDEPIRLLGDGLLYYKDNFRGDNVSFFDEKYWTAPAKSIYSAGKWH